ncbi:MAG: dUTP diphosphatase [candidate division SR1 bacterium]|nr:MAG: dUTP diphosphatase [candidate division SR1 bacterium]
MKIAFTKLSDKAIVPSQNTTTDAGYDLASVESYTLKPGERKLLKTNIACAIPQGYYGRVAPRSGLAYKKGIDVLAGVIDSGYRGDIGVILINFGDEDFEVKEGDRIAQFIIEKCHTVEWTEVASVEDLDASERGEGGFGSSGV